jgi:hypothetical protein
VDADDRHVVIECLSAGERADARAEVVDEGLRLARDVSSR